jgi:DNA-binding transcriptional LysR family regulator
MLGFAHLEALITIAELGSFRAAADRLGVTQPTVSMRIKELEQHLNAQLFDRGSYRPQLTAEGREVLKYARRIDALVRDMQDCAQNGAGMAGTVRLGAADTFALTYLPALLAELEAEFPKLKVALDIDYSFNLNLKLHKGDLDIAFLTSPAPGPDVRIDGLMPVELAWVASPRLELAVRRLTPADLKDVPIITNPEPSNLYTSVLAWFGGAGLEPLRLSTCNSLTHMVRLATAAVGVSLLPTAILEPELASGALQVLEAEPPIEAHYLAMAVRIAPTAPDLSALCAIVHRLVDGSDVATRLQDDAGTMDRNDTKLTK